MTRITEEAADAWGSALEKSNCTVTKAAPLPGMAFVDMTKFAALEQPRLTLVVARRFFAHNKPYLDDKSTVYLDLSSYDFSLKKLRGITWTNVLLINISQTELAYTYPSVYGAIRGGCFTNKVIPTEIYV